jgi:hypothetical protein
MCALVPVCVCVCVCVCVLYECLVPMEGRSGHWILWN